MLRPQVFAFCDGEVQVGLIASEKQAIDATLQSLSKDDKRICPVADRYWNARGGSHTDGGAFIFNLEKDTGGQMRMTCTDKFGKPVPMPKASRVLRFHQGCRLPCGATRPWKSKIDGYLRQGNAAGLFEFVRDGMPDVDVRRLPRGLPDARRSEGRSQQNTAAAIEVFTLLNDRRYPTGGKKRSHLLHIVRSELDRLLRSLPKITANDPSLGPYRLIDLADRRRPAGAATRRDHAGHRRGGFPAGRRRLRCGAAGATPT